MNREMVFRNVTEEGETPSIEVSVRLTNGHFESWVSAPMGDPEAARAAILAWQEAMEAVLNNPNVRRREARNMGAATTSALPEALVPKKRKGRKISATAAAEKGTADGEGQRHEDAPTPPSEG
jgi:hypothetical protein